MQLNYKKGIRIPSSIVFCLGLVFGWLGASSLGLHRSLSCETLWNNAKTSSRPTAVDDFRAEFTVNASKGWRSIDIFVGQAKQHVDENGESLSPKWVAQARQDEAIFSLLKNKSAGLFVDLAANDAVLLSNTYSLEKFYGWKGICIEPNPIYWYNLTHRRPNCQTVGAVVGTPRDQPVHFFYGAGDHGGIAGAGFDNGDKFRTRSKIAYTVTLHEILQRHRCFFQTCGETKAKMTIDYLSLDVEGAENFVMQGFPFGHYSIHLITVERPKETLRHLLEENGFHQIQKLSRWGETLWAHEDIQAKLDVSRLDEFSGRRQYLEGKARRESLHTG